MSDCCTVKARNELSLLVTAAARVTHYHFWNLAQHLVWNGSALNQCSLLSATLKRLDVSITVV